MEKKHEATKVPYFSYYSHNHHFVIYFVVWATVNMVIISVVVLLHCT